MFSKIRYLLAYIMIIGGAHMCYVFYGKKSYIVYFAFSIVLILKGVVECVRYLSKKGINSFENILLRKRNILSTVIVLISFSLLIYLGYYFYKSFIGSTLVISGFNAFLKTLITLIDLFAALVFFLIILIDYLLLSTKKYQIEQGIKESGKEGEKLVYKELKKYTKNNKNTILYKNILLKYQEFDNILVTEKAIINIEVKNYRGKNVKLNIDENGNWTKEKYKKRVSIISPKEQIERHRDVLDSIFQDKYKIYDILVLANDNIILEGSRNFPYKIVKLSNVISYIDKIESGENYKKEDFNEIKKLIKNNKEDKRN
ncbi:MAG: nuclease-related domain-containing protein [Clostridiaceae bacterium]